MEIIFHRGDSHRVNFIIRDENKQPITFIPDEIYFTVKRHAAEKRVLFQKRLSNGTIYPGDATGSYGFIIEPGDTDNLNFESYPCDIEVVADALSIKQTFEGIMTLKREVTHACNEGDES